MRISGWYGMPELQMTGMKNPRCGAAASRAISRSLWPELKKVNFATGRCWTFGREELIRRVAATGPQLYYWLASAITMNAWLDQ
jgi:hypothetical protein